MFEYKKLKGKIVEVFGTQSRFAKALNISEVSLSRKLNGLTNFSQEDVVKWSELLGIDLADVGLFFYQ